MKSAGVWRASALALLACLGAAPEARADAQRDPELRAVVSQASTLLSSFPTI
jgi:hypothetical protein